MKNILQSSTNNIHPVRRLAFLMGLLATLLVIGAVQAQSTVTDDEVNSVASGLYCPVCESTPLDVCPTQACRDWRELIRDQLASGLTEEEIHDYFALQYGDQVLSEPPRRGFSLVVWLLPALAIPVGAVVFGRYLKQIRREDDEMVSAEEIVPEPAQAETPQAADLDNYIEQIEAELNNE